MIGNNLNYNLVINATMKANMRAATRQVNTSLKMIQDELQRTRSHLKEMGALAGSGLGLMELGRRMQQTGLMIAGSMFKAAQAVATMGREFQLYKATFNFFYGDRADSLWRRTKILAATSRFTTRSVTELVATMGKFEGAADVVFQQFTKRNGGTQTALETLQDILMMNPTKSSSDMVRAMSEIMSEPGKRSMLALRRLFQIPSNVINKVYSQFTEDTPAAEKLRMTLEVLTKEYGGLMGAARETFDFYAEQVKDVAELIRQEMFERNEALMMHMAKKVFEWLYSIYKNQRLMRKIADNFKAILKIIDTTLDVLMILGDLITQIASNSIFGKLFIAVAAVGGAFMILAGGLIKTVGMALILGTSIVGMVGALKALQLQELENIAVTDAQTRSLYAQAGAYGARAAASKTGLVGRGTSATSKAYGMAPIGLGAGGAMLTGRGISGIKNPLNLKKGKFLYSPYTGFMPLSSEMSPAVARALSTQAAFAQHADDIAALSSRLPQGWTISPRMFEGKGHLQLIDPSNKPVSRLDFIRRIATGEGDVGGFKSRAEMRGIKRVVGDIGRFQHDLNIGARGTLYSSREAALTAFRKEKGWGFMRRMTEMPRHTLWEMNKAWKEFSLKDWIKGLGKADIGTKLSAFSKFLALAAKAAFWIGVIIDSIREASRMGGTSEIFNTSGMSNFLSVIKFIFKAISQFTEFLGVVFAGAVINAWQLVKMLFQVISGALGKLTGGSLKEGLSDITLAFDMIIDTVRVLFRSLLVLLKVISLHIKAWFEPKTSLEEAGKNATKAWEGGLGDVLKMLDNVNIILDDIMGKSGKEFHDAFNEWVSNLQPLLTNAIFMGIYQGWRMAMFYIGTHHERRELARWQRIANGTATFFDKRPFEESLSPQAMIENLQASIRGKAAEENELAAEARDFMFSYFDPFQKEADKIRGDTESSSAASPDKPSTYTPPSYSNPSFGGVTINVYPQAGETREQVIDAIKEASEDSMRQFTNYQVPVAFRGK